MLNLTYPRSFSDDFQGHLDLFDYGSDIKLLLEDYAESRWAIAKSLTGAEYKYRVCIVIAEMFTTPAQRIAKIVDFGSDYKVLDGKTYKIIDIITTSVHYTSDVPAPKPILDESKYPKGFIVFHSGSFHESFTYVLLELTEEEIIHLDKTYKLPCERN